MHGEPQDSTLRTRRSWALFLLLPFANGMLIVAGPALAIEYSGVRLMPSAEFGLSASYLIESLILVVALMSWMFAIQWINLLVLSGIYRRNFFSSWKRILGRSEGGSNTDLVTPAAFLCAAIAIAGFFAAFFLIGTTSLSRLSPDLWIFFIVAMFVGLTFPESALPIIAQGERSMTGNVTPTAPV